MFKPKIFQIFVSIMHCCECDVSLEFRFFITFGAQAQKRWVHMTVLLIS